tara:strand:+ start:2159 stop:2500 length:342 start_codon:yes stop_codon:yes gene_type:complete
MMTLVFAMIVMVVAAVIMIIVRITRADRRSGGSAYRATDDGPITAANLGTNCSTSGTANGTADHGPTIGCRTHRGHAKQKCKCGDFFHVSIVIVFGLPWRSISSLASEARLNT